MAYDTANTYETIELFGLTEKDAQLPIPEDHILSDHIIRESFESLLGQLRGTGLEAEIEPLAHGLATILQRRKVALGKEVDRTADKIGALAKSHDGAAGRQAVQQTAERSEPWLRQRFYFCLEPSPAQRAKQSLEALADDAVGQEVIFRDRELCVLLGQSEKFNGLVGVCIVVSHVWSPVVGCGATT